MCTALVAAGALFVGLLMLAGVRPATAQELAVAEAGCVNSAATPAGSSIGLVGDCTVLLAAKDALRGTATLNWSRDLTIREWDGITVDIGISSVRVTRLELPGWSLTGVIPPELGDLAALERLDLSGNRLTGGRPAALGKLGNLRALRLQGNRLTGDVPREWASLNLARAGSGPPLGFTQTEYFLHPRTFIAYDNMPKARSVKFWRSAPTMPVVFFDQVVVEAGSETAPDVKYAVEALPDKSTHQFCADPPTPENCLDLGIAVGEDNGFLFAKVDEPCQTCGAHYTDDYPTQRMELSVSPSRDPGLKVYREVLVKRPETSSDCSDFPDKNVDRYTCLFLGERLPAEPPPTTDTLREALPTNLIQPKENYSLIFAEEFNGNVGQDLPTDRCFEGLETLDGDLWNWYPHCPLAYDEVPCVNIQNGHYRMSQTSWCGGFTDTNGAFDFKYGYLEVKYRVDIGATHPFWHNLALHIGDAGSPGRTEWQNYNVPRSKFEHRMKYVETEIDVFEHFGMEKFDTYHQYGNWAGPLKVPDAAPRQALKRNYYCGAHVEPNRRDYAVQFRPPSCRQNEIRVTKGVEWTPRGYRTFLKVEGLHDEFMVLPKKNIQLNLRKVNLSGNTVTWGVLHRPTGRDRDYFFEHVEHGNADTVLEQISVAHTPASLWLSAYGGGGSLCSGGRVQPCDQFTDIVTQLEVDYIRIFQPTNRYADMEPVYK